MGVELTILLPSAGLKVDNGLCVGVTDTEAAFQFSQLWSEFLFAANSPVTELNVLVDYIEKGAKLIGEIKYDMPGDSPELWAYAEIAQQYKIPILIHFENQYGVHLDEFETTLKRFPDVNFIGHAVQFWAELEGMTEYLMSSYDNLYGDVSAGSGFYALNSDCAFEFVKKHQDRLLFGSDCPDIPAGNFCQGCCTSDKVKSLVDKSIQEKIFYKNAKKLLSLGEK